MDKKSHPFYKQKGWSILLVSFVLLLVAVLSANQFADAAPLILGRKPTLTNQERKLKEIEAVKERIKKETNPTAQAALYLQMKSAEIDATSEAIAEILLPTYNVIASTENAVSTEKAKNLKEDRTPRLATPFKASTAYAVATERAKDPNAKKTPHDLMPGESGLTIPFPMPNQNKKLEYTTVWVEIIDVLHSTKFYAGGIQDTDQGIIYLEDELAHQYTVFIVGGMGELSIVDQQENFLVLKGKSNDELYFDTLTLQFTTSMTGTVTPITTIMPTQTAAPTQPPAPQDTPAYPYP